MCCKGVFFLKRKVNLNIFLFSRFKDIDLKSKCCISIITSPNPNSTAEKIRKKNVKESRLTLSKIKPTISVIMYSEIHNNSAVNNKWIAVLIFTSIISRKKKKKKKIRFKSPNTIYLENFLMFKY